MSYESQCSEILDLFRATGKDIPHEDSDMGRAVQILQIICDTQNHTVPTPNEDETPDEIESNASEIFEALEEIETHIGEDDFTLDFDGNEYRLINDSDIWDIYKEEIQNTIEECYDLNLDKIPHFVSWSIDWEQTAQNCLVDGYGYQFSSYDHSEAESAGYWIFRTN